MARQPGEAVPVGREPERRRSSRRKRINRMGCSSYWEMRQRWRRALSFHCYGLSGSGDIGALTKKALEAVRVTGVFKNGMNHVTIIYMTRVARTLLTDPFLSSYHYHRPFSITHSCISVQYTHGSSTLLFCDKHTSHYVHLLVWKGCALCEITFLATPNLADS